MSLVLSVGHRGSMPQFVGIKGVAERYGGVLSIYVIREKARRGEMPCIKHPGSRAYLFRLDWLDAWDEGAELDRHDIRTKAGKGRVVRPVGIRAGRNVT